MELVSREGMTPADPGKKEIRQAFNMVNIRWLWVPLLGGSLLLAIPGNSTFTGILGDVVGHFFSAALLAVVPIAGYRWMYERIGEKEITYIFAASWVYLVLTQFVNS